MELIISTRNNHKLTYNLAIQIGKKWGVLLEFHRPNPGGPIVLSIPVPDDLTSYQILELGLLLGNLKTGVTIIPSPTT